MGSRSTPAWHRKLINACKHRVTNYPNAYTFTCVAMAYGIQVSSKLNESLLEKTRKAAEDLYYGQTRMLRALEGRTSKNPYLKATDFFRGPALRRAPHVRCVDHVTVSMTARVPGLDLTEEYKFIYQEEG